MAENSVQLGSGTHQAHSLSVLLVGMVGLLQRSLKLSIGFTGFWASWKVHAMVICHLCPTQSHPV